MQILVPKCTNPLFYNFHCIQSKTHLFSSSFVAYFRSTSSYSEKRKSKWFNSPDFGDAKPSKTFIKYKTRQKRADAKKALNDIYFGNGSSKFTLEGEYLRKRWTNSWDDDPTENKNRRHMSARRWYDDSTENKHKRDSSARRWDDYDDPMENKHKRDSSAQRWDDYDDPTENKHKRDPSARYQRKKKNKWKRANPFEEFDDEEDDNLETHFQAKFGNQRYSWSFKSWEESFSQSKKSGFEYSNTRNKWRTVSDDESSEDDDSYVVGSHSDRIALGLPTNGPLKIEEVKNAFRLSALKWHPDKHQGPSQALAEEKFKLCASAYKSLCNALSQV